MLIAFIYDKNKQTSFSITNFSCVKEKKSEILLD